jgi:hypothetical protein
MAYTPRTFFFSPFSNRARFFRDAACREKKREIQIFFSFLNLSQKRKRKKKSNVYRTTKPSSSERFSEEEKNKERQGGPPSTIFTRPWAF